MAMIKKLEYLLGMSTAQPVFVIGTGRSGTHWLGHALESHPEVSATIEVEPMFGLSTSMALDPALEEQSLKRLIRAYKGQLFKAVPRIYVDKTHPNIWIAEKLKEAFPKALFVGIERNPYATVASMMRHSGVLAWHKRWQEFPVPNRFLGITAETAEIYDDIPLASQCAMRWLAHHNRMRELKNILGDDLMIISYESFARDTENTISGLNRFLGLREAIPVPEVKLDSLNKWQTQLSQTELIEIQNVVGFSAESVSE